MPIKMKRSAVAGKIPTTAQLDLGELAVNTRDGKIYLKTDDGAGGVAVQEFRNWAELSSALDGKLSTSGGEITGTNGIDFNPGSDVDVDLLTVGVTDAPRLYWDESLSAFRTTETVVTDNDLRVVGGYVKIGEQAAAQADTEGYGQLWVRDDAPNTLMFTDDAGNSGEVLLSAKAQTLTNKTIASPVINGALRENVYEFGAVSGAQALNPANGAIQTITLAGNVTFTHSLNAGETLTLLINDGSAFSVTWPTMTWMTGGGSAPTLKTSGFTTVVLTNIGGTLYGWLAGDEG